MNDRKIDPMFRLPLKALCFLVCAFLLGAARAEVLQPRSDAEVIETLPGVVGSRAEERRLRQQWAANPRDPVLAAALARRYLDQARDQGEPRFAGRALAVLQAWPDVTTAPDDVVLMLATVQQFLHDFEGSTANLERLVARRPSHAQAWLTLATIRRVQGRYAESDKACGALAAIPTAALYAQACAAENEGLRGEFAKTRTTIRQLLATPQLPAATQTWLLTTLAETEARAGRSADAEKTFRAALRLQADDYASLSFADFLMEAGRHADALAVLERLVRTDAVVLRLAMVGTRLKTADAARDAQDMRARVTQANLRPQAQTLHAREQAMFALVVENQPERALELARVNLTLQREPIDVLLLAQAARAAGQVQAVREAEQLRDQMGLKDARLDALL
jgi:tetratricopeptide (TPR) repeat protein